MNVVTVDSDVGKIKLIFTVVYADPPLSRDVIDRVLSECSRDDIYSVVVSEKRVLSLYQIVYSVYLAVRGSLAGLKIARKVELDVLCYMACTDRIREAVETISVRDSSQRVLVLTFCRECPNQDLLNHHLGVLNKLCSDASKCDLVQCVRCFRFSYESPPSCNVGEDSNLSLDFMETIASMLIRRFE